MIKIGICDDDVLIAQVVYEALNLIGNELNQGLRINTYLSAEALLESIELGEKFDLIFMDIEMDVINGIEAGTIIRDNYKLDDVHLIYMSYHESYYYELFELRLSGYLKKPFYLERVKSLSSKIIRKILSNHVKDSVHFFEFKLNGITNKKPIKDINYLESKGRRVNIYSNNGMEYFYSTLNKENTVVSKHDFVRIHQSYIVNLNIIKEISRRNVELLNGVNLPVSDKYNKTLKKSYLEFRRCKIE